MRIDTAEFVLSANHGEQFVNDGRPEVAFVGRSNVGKSSLMNQLLGRKGLARTSSTPGRTRAINYFLVNRRLYFVDLPGYGFARAARTARQQWAELIDLYFRWERRQERARVLLVLLIDGKVGATDLDLEAYAYLVDLGLDPLVVATKIDKVSRSRRASQLSAIRDRLGLGEGEDVLPVSATTGEGIKQLWKGISAFLDDHPERPQAP